MKELILRFIFCIVFAAILTYALFLDNKKSKIKQNNYGKNATLINENTGTLIIKHDTIEVQK